MTQYKIFQPETIIQNVPGDIPNTINKLPPDSKNIMNRQECLFY